MKKIGIFYGSTTGTTQKVAYSIARALGVKEADIHNVASTAPSEVEPYDILVLGTSTWGNGDLQDDWYDFLDGLDVLDLTGKDVALFGCGDETMVDTFCSAVGKIHDRLASTGCRFIAPYNIVGYRFDDSQAMESNKIEAEGLLIDEVNHPELTAPRVAGWATIVRDAAEK